MNIPCPTGVDDWSGAKGGGVKDILSRIPDCEMQAVRLQNLAILAAIQGSWWITGTDERSVFC